MTLYKLLTEANQNQKNETAIIWEDKKITYNQFFNLVNSIIGIIKDKKIENEAIAIELNRSPVLIATMIAIIETGNYYIPIDKFYPKERKDYILSKANVNTIFVEEELLNEININNIINISSERYIKENKEKKYQYTSTDNIENLAYCLFTSGSTGYPKGVCVSQKALISFINSFGKAIPIYGRHSILCATTQSFDIFGVESLYALSRGWEIILATEQESRNSRILIRLIKENNIDIIQMTPSRMEMILNSSMDTNDLLSIKHMIIGGESFPINLYQKLKDKTDCEIYNIYGPTESTIWCAVSKVSEEIIDNKYGVSVGTPFENVEFIVINEGGEEALDGEEGELCISGQLLANGYINDTELTKEKFKLFNSKIYYQTNDICVKKNGNYYILGRLDNQIKLNGFRIELEEIENVANMCSFINKSLAVPRKNGNVIRNIDLLYTSNEIHIVENKIREFLNQFLPTYMIPSNIIRVTKFNYTENGKIDRKNISNLKYSSSVNNDKKDEIQIQVEELIKEILEEQIEFVNSIVMNQLLNSIEIVDLIVRIEEMLDICIEDKYLVNALSMTFEEFMILIKDIKLEKES